jgi:chromosome segregation ATPase
MTIPADAKLKEKLARIDRLEAKFSDSIMSVKGLDGRIKAVESFIQEAQNTSKDVKKSIKDVSDAVTSVASKSQSLESSIASVSSRLNEQQVLHDKHTQKCTEIDRNAAILGRVSVDVTKLQQKQGTFAEQSDVDEKHAINTVANAAIQKSVTSMQAIAQSNQDSIDKLSKSHTTLLHYFDDIRDRIEDVISSHTALSGLINDTKDDLNAKLSRLEATLTKNTDQKIQSIKPSIDPQGIATTVKGMVKTDIEHIATDASNASLKFNNLDNQVKLIEKKIENIYLLIKKAELAKSS